MDKGNRRSPPKVAAQDGVDAIYEALIGEVLNEGAWDSCPDEVRRSATKNGPGSSYSQYVDVVMPEAAAFARIGPTDMRDGSRC